MEFYKVLSSVHYWTVNIYKWSAKLVVVIQVYTICSLLRLLKKTLYINSCHELNKVNNWISSNRICINADKRKYMIFSCRKLLHIVFSSRGAREYSFSVFPSKHCMFGKHWHSNCKRLAGGGEGTPHPELLTGGKKIQTEVPD